MRELSLGTWRSYFTGNDAISLQGSKKAVLSLFHADRKATQERLKTWVKPVALAVFGAAAVVAIYGGRNYFSQRSVLSVQTGPVIPPGTSSLSSTSHLPLQGDPDYTNQSFCSPEGTFWAPSFNETHEFVEGSLQFSQSVFENLPTQEYPAIGTVLSVAAILPLLVFGGRCYKKDSSIGTSICHRISAMSFEKDAELSDTEEEACIDLVEDETLQQLLSGSETPVETPPASDAEDDGRFGSIDSIIISVIEPNSRFKSLLLEWMQESDPHKMVDTYAKKCFEGSEDESLLTRNQEQWKLGLDVLQLLHQVCRFIQSGNWAQYEALCYTLHQLEELLDHVSFNQIERHQDILEWTKSMLAIAGSKFQDEQVTHALSLSL